MRVTAVGFRLVFDLETRRLHNWARRWRRRGRLIGVQQNQTFAQQTRRHNELESVSFGVRAKTMAIGSISATPGANGRPQKAVFDWIGVGFGVQNRHFAQNRKIALVERIEKRRGARLQNRSAKRRG